MDHKKTNIAILTIMIVTSVLTILFFTLYMNELSYSNYLLDNSADLEDYNGCIDNYNGLLDDYDSLLEENDVCIDDYNELSDNSFKCKEGYEESCTKIGLETYTCQSNFEGICIPENTIGGYCFPGETLYCA